jgi:hypothetical protein
MALFGLLAGGLLLAVLVLAMVRWVVAIGGGLIGCYAGYHAWPNVMRAVGHAEMIQRMWIGGLVGALAVGVLCFLCFRLIIMILTSVEGGMLVISGAVALCLHHHAIGERVRMALIGNRYVLPVLFTVPSVIGFALQYNAFRHPPASQSSQSGGGAKKAGAAA